MVGQPSRWAWFLAAADDTGSPEQSEELRKLYDAPRVVSREP
jgi:hypothetical protein